MTKQSKFFKVFVSCCLIFVQVTTAYPKSDSRIVGGTSATIDEAPYLVQIFKDGGFHCGGTVASDRHIITAAHCVKGMSPDSFTVVAAATRLTDYGIRSKVSKIIINANYNEYTYDSDIAVLKLRSSILGPKVKIAPTCDHPISPQDPVQLFGWGALYENANFLPLELQTVHVKVVDQNTCRSLYNRYSMTITNNMFCAALPEQDSCNGDSGGPVMVKGKFCGVVSFGIGCARSDSPGVYTKIEQMDSFLRKALAQ